MPSLWKKHQKGKKISRLVVDLQTCPKQHETLVGDNGVSTSLDDILGKNKDKLKKLSKKKQRSSKKYNAPITMEEYDHSSLPILQKLNGKYAPQSRFEASNFSSDNQNKYELILHDNECRTTENKASYNVMHVIWLNIAMGILVTAITLYYNMFNFGIILGVMFLIIFEYAGDLYFPLVKNRNVIVLKSISKGFFVAVVTLCTNRVLVGISIAICALFLLGFVKKIIFPFLKHCQDGKDKHDQPEFKQRNGDIEIVMNTGFDIHSKSKKEGQENGDELQVKDDIPIVDEGNGGGSDKVIVKQVNRDNKPVNTSSSSEDEKIWNEIINEIDSLDHNYSVWPRQSPQAVHNPAEGNCGQLGKIESKGKTKTIDECSNDIVIERGKLRKRRKFWKKLVPKHMRKNKKNKHAKEGHEMSVDFLKENETEFEDTEMEEVEVEDSSSISSDENEDGEEQYASANNSYNERSQANNGGTKKDIAKESKKDIVKVLIVMIIPLVGLLSGRVFAFVLTLIGCVLFNMLRG